MAPRNMVTVIERCQVSPPPGSVPNSSLPLTFSDVSWIGFAPVQRLVFYHHPISKTRFTETIIPNLKNSLSLALKHFWPLSGNLVIHSDTTIKPEIRYTDDGDSSVSLVFAESSFLDFEYLVGNQPRNCNEFYPLVAQLPPPSQAAGLTSVPLVALQVTLFPEIGICIGISNDHVGGDGSSMYAFIKAWANFCRDSTLNELTDLPFFDRRAMGNIEDLNDFIWNQIRDNIGITKLSRDLPMDSDKLRATFVISPEDIRRLKNYVSSKQPSVHHLSTFTVVYSHVWTCSIKSRTVNEDELEYGLFPVDCRGRSEPPIPGNYFGNCIIPCMASTEHRKLAGEEGFLVAAELIGEAIRQRFHNKEGLFHGCDEIFSELPKLNWERVLSVAGSPRQNYYSIDFGFGKPKKFEFVSIDMTGAFSISGGRDSAGIEIGFTLAKKRMDAFLVLFEEGLKGF